MLDRPHAKRLREVATAIDEATAERDQAIIDAYLKGGGGLREIGEAVGMTHRAISKLLERHGVRERLSPDAPDKGNWYG